MAKSSDIKSRLMFNQIAWRGNGDRGVALYTLQFPDGGEKTIRQHFIKREGDSVTVEESGPEPKFVWSWDGNAEYPTFSPNLKFYISSTNEGEIAELEFRNGKLKLIEGKEILELVSGGGSLDFFTEIA